MKLLLTLLLFSFWANAQITSYTQSTVNDFHLLGGYTYTQNTFSNGPQANPFVVSGPYPQNSFSYVVSARGGIKNVNNSISTAADSTDIVIEFKNNNVRKFGCRAIPVLFNNPIFALGGKSIQFTAYTNLGNSAIALGGTNNVFVGFKVNGDNEYLTKIVASFNSSLIVPSNNSAISIKNIVVGDNIEQNTALHFDGIDDYLELPSGVGNFATNAPFTVSCWFRPDPYATGEQNLINKWAGSGGYAFTLRYYGNDGSILAGQYDGSIFNYVYSSSAVDLKDGNWHHVAFSFNGTTFFLYVDGQLHNSFTDNVTGTTTNSTPLQIGREATGNKLFKGEIDEVRIWLEFKNLATIQNEMYCKNPNTTNLQAAYNFNNGSPNGNNALIDKVKDIAAPLLSSYDGTLSNGFNLTGDVSNFVTGQVKYVKLSGLFYNDLGSSWNKPFAYLHTALAPRPCNDLFDVYVSKGYTDPADDPFENTAIVSEPQAKVSKLRGISSTSTSFNIPSGMRIYGGFAGTEKNINERNTQEIFGVNKVTLSGDLGFNDFAYTFFNNRNDNSNHVVKILNSSNTVVDGFMIKGGFDSGLSIANSTGISINNCRFIDNYGYLNGALLLSQSNTKVSNSIFAGNGSVGIKNLSSPGLNNTFQNCQITSNAAGGVSTTMEDNGISNSYLINCTIASNLGIGVSNTANASTQINNYIKNTIIYDNGVGLNASGMGTVFDSHSFSFIQGIVSGFNMIDASIYQPQFYQPVSNSNLPSQGLGNYRLKWCSKAIDAGTNEDISLLDFDRKERAFNGAPDMGAYEFYGNTPNSQPDNHITGLINSSTYLGTANQTLTSDAKILAPASVIDFNAANSITLNPGFEVQGIGQYFRAQIGGNVGCVNN